ncbi:2-dehydropantoate 2-reductase [Reyranella sp. MMS21-HV4-11]|uniref:2-dehydropantoate 2-reductase n=1 Tax=Reyranella humidisoli TaxID=2849149 RepID=A0ABS6IPQ0_9HYPH|nr:2-dehydropantoate 2-reductase [Reyranella sp. MMS21-HV4-11]MBU8876306.1 2-dehydropantoate 2-reductase [Reyranella sp. MMS21-HV4-11]
MKVCIVGAGAIGGLIGARLAASTDCQVSALARGETLAALNAEGWRLKQGDGLITGKAHASSDARELGPQDLVVVAVKAPSMAPIAAQIGALLKPDTIVLPAMNGVPWWFSQGLPAVGEQPLQSVDPGGAIARAIPLRHVIGCVVHLSAATTEPGLVQHRNGMGLIVGEPDGSTSARLETLHELLARAGFDVTSSDAIRHDIWYKLWGNMTMNPVSAITGATGDRMLDDPLVRAFCSAAMREAAAIGARIGCVIDQDPEARHAITRELGAFKTSMLVDVERGKPIELDAIVTAVHELGRRTGVPTPNIDALLGLTRLFARTRGLLPG